MRQDTKNWLKWTNIGQSKKSSCKTKKANSKSYSTQKSKVGNVVKPTLATLSSQKVRKKETVTTLSSKEKTILTGTKIATCINGNKKEGNMARLAQLGHTPINNFECRRSSRLKNQKVI